MAHGSMALGDMSYAANIWLLFTGSCYSIALWIGVALAVYVEQCQCCVLLNKTMSNVSYEVMYVNLLTSCICGFMSQHGPIHTSLIDKQKSRLD